MSRKISFSDGWRKTTYSQHTQLAYILHKHIFHRRWIFHAHANEWSQTWLLHQFSTTLKKNNRAQYAWITRIHFIVRKKKGSCKWASNLKPCDCEPKVLQTVLHRINIYASSCVVLCGDGHRRLFTRFSVIWRVKGKVWKPIWRLNQAYICLKTYFKSYVWR